MYPTLVASYHVDEVASYMKTVASPNGLPEGSKTRTVCLLVSSKAFITIFVLEVSPNAVAYPANSALISY